MHFCLASGHPCVPKCLTKQCNTPGTVNEVTHFMDMAKQWYDLGCAQGEPENGEVVQGVS